MGVKSNPLIYIADMAGRLAVLARDKTENEHLAFLLEMARVEAIVQLDNAADGPVSTSLPGDHKEQEKKLII